jgi:hypothetical protein
MPRQRNSFVPRSPSLRARETNIPHAIAGLDGRSATSRRYRDLIDALETSFGGNVDDQTMVLIQRAAGRLMAAEQIRSRILRDDPVDISELTKLENLADRAMRALGIKLTRKPASDLREYLDSKARAA